MRISQLQAVLKHTLGNKDAQRLVLMLWGPPGSAKSYSVYLVANMLGLKVYEFRLSMLEPIDVHGIPFEVDGRVRWAIPENLPDPDDNTPCVIYIDEYGQGMVSVQNTMAQILSDRRIGEYRLPENAWVIGSTNRLEDRAGTNKMPSQVANRLVHIDVELDPEESGNYALAQGWDDAIVATLRFRPDLVHMFDPTKDPRAYPTMRTWEYVNIFMQSQPEKIGDRQAVYDVVSGMVGEGAAAIYFSVKEKFMTLPDIDKMLRNPKSADLKGRPNDELFAIAVAIVRKLKDELIDNFFVIAKKFPVEMQAMMLSDAFHVFPNVMRNDSFKQWARENKKYFAPNS